VDFLRDLMGFFCDARKKGIEVRTDQDFLVADIVRVKAPQNINQRIRRSIPLVLSIHSDG